MGLFDFLRKKKNTKTKRKRRSRKAAPKTKEVLEKIEAGIENLQTQIRTMQIALKKHDDELLEHTRLVESLRVDEEEFTSLTVSELNSLIENYGSRRIQKFIKGLKKDLNL